MINAARAAARGLSRDFGEVENLQVSRKGPADFVSVADQRAEQAIYEQLAKARPGYGFLMEERGEVVGTDKSHRFIVDPLDGTLNFLHGMPHYAISIALEREGELIAGVVMDVAKQETFWAEKGRGAWRDQTRLRVAGRMKLREAVVATGIPFMGHPGHDLFLKELDQIAPFVAGVRRFGSAALDLAWVAAGRYDGFWERSLKPWDVAAGIVLVREAGGFIRDLTGENGPCPTEILAANPSLTPKILERLGVKLPVV
jgi:myo-inositol-1(or 4)-monophosphatase